MTKTEFVEQIREAVQIRTYQQRNRNSIHFNLYIPTEIKFIGGHYDWLLDEETVGIDEIEVWVMETGQALGYDLTSYQDLKNKRIIHVNGEKEK